MSLLEFKLAIAAFGICGFVMGFAICDIWHDWRDLKKLLKEKEYDNFLNDHTK